MESANFKVHATHFNHKEITNLPKSPKEVHFETCQVSRLCPEFHDFMMYVMLLLV